jgi:hypothetical protein
VPVYATQADYENSPYGASPAPADIDARLAIASDDIDELVITAVYEVNDSGAPTVSAVVEALKKATIAQAKYSQGRGDESGSAQVATEVAIGSARIKYGSSDGSGDGATGRFSPRAVTILRNAGLLPNVIYAPGG